MRMLKTKKQSTNQLFLKRQSEFIQVFHSSVQDPSFLMNFINLVFSYADDPPLLSAQLSDPPEPTPGNFVLS